MQGKLSAFRLYSLELLGSWNFCSGCKFSEIAVLKLYSILHVANAIKYSYFASEGIWEIDTAFYICVSCDSTL